MLLNIITVKIENIAEQITFIQRPRSRMTQLPLEVGSAGIQSTRPRHNVLLRNGLLYDPHYLWNKNIVREEKEDQIVRFE